MGGDIGSSLWLYYEPGCLNNAQSTIILFRNQLGATADGHAQKDLTIWQIEAWYQIDCMVNWLVHCESLCHIFAEYPDSSYISWGYDLYCQ